MEQRIHIPSGHPAPAAVWEIAGPLMAVAGPVIRRVLSDEQMDTVWPELLRWPPASMDVERIHPRLRLGTYGIPTPNILLLAKDEARKQVQEQTAAAVFAFVAIEFSQPRPYGTRRELDKLVKTNMRTATSPAQKEEVRWMRNKAEEGPYFTDLRRVALEQKGRFRALCAEIKALYGLRMPLTTRTLANVALQFDPPISRSSANEWKDGILPRPWSKSIEELNGPQRLQ
jgi:hypothetical protein